MENERAGVGASEVRVSVSMAIHCELFKMKSIMLTIIAIFGFVLCLSMNMASSAKNGVIIGHGRIGSLLYELNGKKDTLLTSRSDDIPNIDGPIYVCTRNNDLEAIIDKCPPSKRENLVFVQNGILTPYLKNKGLEENTQALVYFAVSKLGQAPIDSITDTNPEGLTAVTGKWADDFKSRLNAADLACNVLDKELWTVAMLEKHIWICAFMAVGAKYGCSVGQVERKHSEEIRTVIGELGRTATLETEVSFPAGLDDRLCAYARSVAHFPTALKEFEWRNGWFANISFKYVVQQKEDPCPSHTAILASQGNFLFNARKKWILEKKSRALVVKHGNIQRYK